LPSDIAKILDVPESDIMAAIAAGELPAKTTGSSHRIPSAYNQPRL
jgi:hypothetical protein